MKTVAELKQEKLAVVGKMRAMLDAAEKDDRDLTDEENEQYEGFEAALAKLDREISRREALEATEATLEATAPPVSARAPPAVPPGPEASREFESFGEFMHAVRFRPSDQRLATLFKDFDDEGQRGMQAEQRMDTGSSGGFAVPEQFRDELMQVEMQDAVIRPRATVIPAGFPPDAAITIPALDQTGAVPDNVYGGVKVVKTAEGGSKPETSFSLRQIKLEPQEFSGYMEATDKLLRNWSAAGALIQKLFRGAMISTEDREFLRGNGVGGPLGIANAGATYDVTRETSNTITYVDLVSMVSRMLMRGGSPIWMISQSCMATLLQLRNPQGSPYNGDGQLIFQPSAVPGMPSMLLGYPIVWHERAQALGTAGDVTLADLRYYLIKDGSGPFVASSEHVKFQENKTVFKIFWNVDGQPWLTAPFKQEGGYEVSPFVMLN